jgi:hypothetical protein
MTMRLIAWTNEACSAEQVAQTLRYPDTYRLAKSRHAKRFEKALPRNKRLAVIAQEKPTEFWVITVFWM